MATTIPPRSKVNKKSTWNAESLFPSVKAWDAEVKKIIADIPNVKKYEGHLGDGASTLLEALDAIEKLVLRAYRVFVYPRFLLCS